MKSCSWGLNFSLLKPGLPSPSVPVIGEVFGLEEACLVLCSCLMSGCEEFRRPLLLEESGLMLKLLPWLRRSSSWSIYVYVEASENGYVAETGPASAIAANVELPVADDDCEVDLSSTYVDALLYSELPDDISVAAALFCSECCSFWCRFKSWPRVKCLPHIAQACFLSGGNPSCRRWWSVFLCRARARFSVKVMLHCTQP